jgi:hypothetical protein
MIDRNVLNYKYIKKNNLKLNKVFKNNTIELNYNKLFSFLNKLFSFQNHFGIISLNIQHNFFSRNWHFYPIGGGVSQDREVTSQIEIHL